MSELNFQQMPKWIPEALEIQALVETWARAYEVPREAIIRQIPIAYAWAMSNKNKAPKKNIIRYLFNFMRKAKEFGNLTVAPKSQIYKEEIVEEDMTIEEMRKIREENMGRKNG